MPEAVVAPPCSHQRPADHRRWVAGLAVMALLAASCSSGAGDAAGDEAAPSTNSTTTTTNAPSTTEPDVASAPSPAPEPLSGLDGSIGDASDLAISWLNGAPLDEAAYNASFDDVFRNAISYSDLLAGLDQVTGDGPYVVQDIRQATETQAEIVLVGTSGVPGLLALSIVSADDPIMNALFLGPTEIEFDMPEGVDDAVARLESMGTLRLGVFDSACSSIGAAVNADDQAPIGSIFKLWVLAAVVDAIDNGTSAWDDEIAVKDELDSYPSGITQDDPRGTLLSVRTLTERMIEISDNTATNHLIDLVGREAVEQAMVDSGHSEPERNLPMLDAREFTIVKFGDADLRTRYIEAGEAERRQILANEVATAPLPPIENIVTATDPIEVETLEWFASPRDLCLILVEVSSNSEAASILSRAPGIPDELDRWEAIRFKGGSEPGVLAMAWLTTNSDGESFVTAGGVANENAVINEFEAASLFAFLRDTAPPR